MKLLHYGLQRSGTNYLETLLEKNYCVEFLNSNSDRRSPIQKHFRLYDAKQIVGDPGYRNNVMVRSFDEFESLIGKKVDRYLVISKDPYSWFLSYCSWAKKCEWKPVQHHYIEEYNLFYGKFIELSKQTEKLCFIRYIDLLCDPHLHLSQLEQSLGLKRRFLSRGKIRLPSKVMQSAGFSNDKKKYYTEQKYLREFSDDELAQLNEKLDHGLAFSLGYETIRAGV